MITLNQWAIRHGITAQALYELESIFTGNIPAVTAKTEQNEATVQSLVRLEASRKGCRLWRNNVGVLQDINGRPVRYGLANDSKQLNENFKKCRFDRMASSDDWPAACGLGDGSVCFERVQSPKLAVFWR